MAGVGPNRSNGETSVGSRSGVLASQLVPAAETTVLTAPTGKSVDIATATLTNTTGGSVNVSVSIVPKAGTAGAANRVQNVKALASNTEASITGLVGARISDGDFISILPSAVGVAVSITGTTVG